MECTPPPAGGKLSHPRWSQQCTITNHQMGQREQRSKQETLAGQKLSSEWTPGAGVDPWALQFTIYIYSYFASLLIKRALNDCSLVAHILKADLFHNNSMISHFTAVAYCLKHWSSFCLATSITYRKRAQVSASISLLEGACAHLLH